jgi:hypothetical protein
MNLIVLTLLVLMIVAMSVSVLRRRREHRRANLARALRVERSKARRQLIPHVSANLCGSTSPEPAAAARPPPIRAA